MLRRGFPLYVGGADPRKNLEMLVRAWGVTPTFVRQGRPLVICGHMPPDRVEALVAEARAAGLREHELLMTGYVSDLELAALYRACGAFVFPSFYEGSGIPMLEAMAFGVPVVAANASTTPEILGDSELTFDPHRRQRHGPRDRSRTGRRQGASAAQGPLTRSRRTVQLGARR